MDAEKLARSPGRRINTSEKPPIHADNPARSNRLYHRHPQDRPGILISAMPAILPFLTAAGARHHRFLCG
jgi:hypothetical protein